MILSVVFLCVLCASCQRFTIAPKPVVSRSVAFDNGIQNAAILGYDRTGLIVTKGWLAKYDALLRAYGSKLPADNQVPAGDRTGISPSGENYHVLFEVNDRFADLKYFERNSGP